MKKALLVVLTLGLILGVVSEALAQDKSDLKKALSYYHRGKFKEAVKYLGDYVDQRPEPAGYYLLGYSLYKLKRFSEAEEYFSQAYLIDPNFSPEHHGMPARPAKKRAPKASTSDVPPPAETKEIPAPKVSERPAPAAATQKSEPQKVAKSGASTPPAAPAGSATTAPAKPATTPPAPPQTAAKSPGAPQTPPATTPPAPAAKPGASPQTPQQATPPAATPPAPQQAVAPQPSKPALPPMPPMGKQPPIPGMAVGLMGGILAGLGIFFLVIVLAVYLFSAFCLYRIATRLNVPAAWTAWVPLLQLWAIVGSAGKPWWWILLLFVPLVNLFVAIYIWLCITENLGHNKWLGLLMLLPVINLLFMAYLAFTKPSAAPSSPSATPEEDLT